MTNITPFNKLKLPPFDGPQLLKFALENSKLELSATRTAAFSLPAGYTCPGAKDCLAWFDRAEKKIKDGPHAKTRCWAATLEAAFPSVRDSYDRNLAILQYARTTQAMAEVINLSLPARGYAHIRVHADGDFFNQEYFLAWMEVARRNPERLFYAYTKSIPIWYKWRNCVPENFVLTASMGGKWDAEAIRHGFRTATIVYHPKQAEAMGLEIDHNDDLAKDPSAGNFALLLHGVQKAGSEPADALKTLRKEGHRYSYSKNKNSKTACR